MLFVALFEFELFELFEFELFELFDDPLVLLPVVEVVLPLELLDVALLALVPGAELSSELQAPRLSANKLIHKNLCIVTPSVRVYDLRHRIIATCG